MSNLLQFPKKLPDLPDNAEASTPVSLQRVKLLDGKITLLKRPQYKKDSWHYEIPFKGGIERKTTKTSDFKEASQIAVARYHEMTFRINKGMSVDPVTFRAAAESYIKSQEYQRSLGSSGKFANLDAHIHLFRKHILPCIGDKQLAFITNADIKAMHEARANNRVNVSKFGPRPPTAVSMSQHEGLVKKVYRHAREEGLITQQETLELKRTKVKVLRRASFTADEMQTVLDQLAANVLQARGKLQIRANKMMVLYVKFCIQLACRPGDEPLSIRFSDIVHRSTDATPKVLIRINDGKTGPRTVMVLPHILDIVDDIKALHVDPKPGDRIFVEDNRLLDDERYSRLFRITLAKLGLSRDALTRERRSLYSIRHYAISKMITDGVSLKFIEKNCGTSAQMINQHYDHVLITQLDQELGKLSA